MADSPSAGWVLRQREMFLGRRRFLRDVVFKYIIQTLLWNITVEGLAHIPAEGGAVLMINHVTAADPLVAVGVVRPRFVVPMSKIENFRTPGIGLVVRSWGAYPVRRGEVDRDALRTTIQLLEAGEVTLMAPEGTRSPGLIQPKDGLAYLTTKVDPPPVIVPTALYNLETWKEDLLKPWRRTPAHVTFGRGFRLRTVPGQRVRREALAAMTDEMMYQLAILLPERNRGVYSDISQMTTDYLDFVEPD